MLVSHLEIESNDETMSPGNGPTKISVEPYSPIEEKLMRPTRGHASPGCSRAGHPFIKQLYFKGFIEFPECDS
jgi:hypothetical protein